VRIDEHLAEFVGDALGIPDRQVKGDLQRFKEFIEAHGGRATDLSIFGQESNPTTLKLAQMNLAIRGIEANLGGRAGRLSSRTTPTHPFLHPSSPATLIERDGSPL